MAALRLVTVVTHIGHSSRLRWLSGSSNRNRRKGLEGPPTSAADQSDAAAASEVLAAGLALRPICGRRALAGRGSPSASDRSPLAPSVQTGARAPGIRQSSSRVSPARRLFPVRNAVAGTPLAWIKRTQKESASTLWARSWPVGGKRARENIVQIGRAHV